MRALRFDPRGLLALPRAAFGITFEVPEEPKVETRDGVTVLHVRGPLMHHCEAFFDSYDAIRDRVAAALTEKPRALVLAIDSPGGLVSGCFETANALRVMAAKAGVPLLAYVDGQATSAAYALACAAEKIVSPTTAMVGSIGVIDALVDTTAQNAMFGVEVRLVASGARKTDGNPNAPITDEAVSASRERVDFLAAFFAEWVSETRGVAAADVLAFEAGIFQGAEALRRGLVDELGSLDDLLATLAGGTTDVAAGPPTEGATMASNYEEGLAKLRKAAEGDDEEAKLARKALAALDDTEDEKKDDEPAGKAESDEPAPEPKKDDEPKPDAKASAAEAIARQALASAERTERRMLLASRPDLDAELRAELEKDSTPLATVENLVAALPRKAPPKAAATAVVSATRGEGQGAGEISRLAPEAKADLDRRMGLSTIQPQVLERGNKLVLGAMVPVTEKGA